MSPCHLFAAQGSDKRQTPSANKKLTTEKSVLHIFELGLGARETGGLSMLPLGENLPLAPLRPQRGDGNVTSLGRISYSQRVLMKRDLHAEVSARIVAELEAGAAPWIKPWSATPGVNTPCNAVTNRPYSGAM
jgi:hypothetical protein